MPDVKPYVKTTWNEVLQMHIISVFSFQGANKHLKKKRSNFLFLSQAFVRYVDIDKETQRAADS